MAEPFINQPWPPPTTGKLVRDGRLQPLGMGLLGGSAFSLVLLTLSTFLKWVDVGGSRLLGGPAVIRVSEFSVSGAHFGDGLVILGVGVTFLTLIGLQFAMPRALAGTAVLGASVATFLLFFYLGRLGLSPGLGIFVGLLASLGFFGTMLAIAILQPAEFKSAPFEITVTFLRHYLWLIVGEGAALLLGIVALILRPNSFGF